MDGLRGQPSDRSSGTPRGSGASVLESLTTSCRAAGLKVTPQRVAVFRSVMATESHPTPEEIFRDVKPSMPSLSLGTVYKTLDCLEDLGLVVRVANEGGSRRYDANIAPHHHLVCINCDSIVDFFDEAISGLQPKVPDVGFSPSRVTVQIHGVCAQCGSAEENTPAKE